jgi:bile acid:Na+ symporter, BASS family
MKKMSYQKVILGFSLLMLLSALIMIITGNTPAAGPLLILFFLSLAVAIRSFSAVKGLSFTVWIFTAVTAAMFYPQYFTSIGDFRTSLLIIPLLQIIMFGMGSQMSFGDFAGIIKMPKGVIVGIVAQFSMMPLIAFSISRIFDFPPEIAAGIILIGCVPSGLASTVMSFLGRANVPLSITLTAVTTPLSPIVTPLLMRTLAGQFIEINAWSMVLDIMEMIILPIIAGFIFNLFLNRETGRPSKVIQLVSYPLMMILTSVIFLITKEASMSEFMNYLMRLMGLFYLLPIVGGYIFVRVFRGDKKIMKTILSYLSMIGIAVIVTVITAAGRESLMVVGFALILTSLLHNIAGYTLGYSLGWIFKMPERDCRTIAFEVGMQNGGMASGLALQMGKIATVGLAPAVFGPLMNITGSVLANFWRSRPPKDSTIADESGLEKK